MLLEDFMHAFDVSRETVEKLEIYHALLLKWQKAINLVSPLTIDEAWSRHFIDSAQIVDRVPGNINILADIGSGAGFPGLVLAITRPEIEVHLIESDERKAQFLRTVSRETTAACTVHDCRIEDAYDLVQPDLITARALASLTDLCGYVLPWAQAKPALEMLFLKGEKASSEVVEAQRSYSFIHENIPSVTAKRSTILHLRNLSTS